MILPTISDVVWYRIFFFFILIGGPGTAQETAMSWGVVLDSLTVAGAPGESYALYLPEAFKAGSPMAIVFIFDPAGRGQLGVTQFIPAAERYHYMLVCSNNIKNGPYDNNLGLADRLFRHIFSEYPVDEGQVYTAGFSGGSRLAVTIAVLSGAIRGVIGCGAGFSGSTTYLPTGKDRFSYVGLVGDLDMNFQEMRHVTSWLTSMGIRNELHIFEGEHQWPPEAEILKAFEWLELQAINTGIRPAGNRFINDAFIEGYRLAREREQQGDILQAVTEYKRLLRNFSDRYILDSIRVKLISLEKSKAYRLDARDRDLVAHLEDTLSAKYIRKFYADVGNGKEKGDFVWWEDRIRKLDKTYVQSDRPYLVKMGKRLRYQVSALAIESFNGYVRAREVPKAEYSASLLLLLDPDEPYYHLRVARGFADLNLIEKSLFHLEQAKAYGWKDMDAVRKDNAFRKLRQNPRFKRLLEGS